MAGDGRARIGWRVMTAAPTYTQVVEALSETSWMTARQVADAIGEPTSLVKRRLDDLVSGSRVDWSRDPSITGGRRGTTGYRLRPPRDPAVVVTGTGV